MKHTVWLIVIAIITFNLSILEGQSIPIRPNIFYDENEWSFKSSLYQVCDHGTRVEIDSSGLITLGGADSTRAITMLMAFIYKQGAQIDSLRQELYWYNMKEARFAGEYRKNASVNTVHFKMAVNKYN